MISGGLPAQCTVEDGALVFWEVADPTQLEDIERLYEYTCFTACTNGFRPLGPPPKVIRHSFPEIAEGEVSPWGGRSMSAEAVDQFRDQGLVLAELRLAVVPMGAAPRPPAPAGGDS